MKGRRGTVSRLTIAVTSDCSVSALLQRPRGSTACLVLAHGAGAGMDHPFLCAAADGLAERKIATLRYQFPFMERGSKRPDAPALARATVRAAVAAARLRLPKLALFAGGKSFGGRMTTQAQAAHALPGVHGIVLFGFPLHPHGRISLARGEHLQQVHVPMLFLQGTRDELADLKNMRIQVRRLGKRATLRVVKGADHGFHVLVRSGRTDGEVQREMLDAVAGWIAGPKGAPVAGRKLQGA